MQALFGDLYNLTTRRYALQWGLKNLHGQNLRDFYYHARSVPHDRPLVEAIRKKIILEQQAGIGQVVVQAGDVQEPPIAGILPQSEEQRLAAEKKRREQQQGGGLGLFWTLLIVGGLIFWGTRSKKK